jgi:benzoate membrane transport protein
MADQATVARAAGLLRDLTMAPVWAGLTCFVWYGFGALPLHLEVAGQLGLSAVQSSSWIFVIWFTGAMVSVALTVHYRIPIPITWTIPGLIYLGTLAGQFTFAELAGANLVAGVAILLLGLLRIGERVMAWLPLPIVMGMFAGSILVYVTRMVAASVEDAAVAGVAVLAYFAGRSVGDPRVPPMGLAVVAGGAAAWASGSAAPEIVAWTLPALDAPEIRFSWSAVAAVSLPMTLLAVGLGNVQGLGFLIAQGYRVPITPVTVAVGLASIANAGLGGHPATVARTGAAILAGPEAGPARGRYWASLIAAVLTLSIALGAAALSSLLAALPRSLVVALAGLAILSSLQSALEAAFGRTLRLGALAAFATATTPFALFGISSGFWSLLAGLAASFLAERAELRAWRRGSEAARPLPQN